MINKYKFEYLSRLGTDHTSPPNSVRGWNEKTMGQLQKVAIDMNLCT
jgi:hypothetical protein